MASISSAGIDSYDILPGEILCSGRELRQVDDV